MEMKMMICGFKNIAGNSKKTGRDFSMHMLFVLEPALITGMVKNAAGYEPREIQCDEQVVAQLARVNYPVEVEAFLLIDRDNKIRVNSVRLSAKDKPGQAAA